MSNIPTAIREALEEQSRANLKLASQRVQVWSAGLVGVSVIVLVQLVAIPQLDRPLKICFYCYLIAIPTLTTVFVAKLEDSRYPRSGKIFWPIDLLWAIGVLSSMAGIGALCTHFSVRATILFVSLSLIGVVAHAHHLTDLDKANRGQ